MSTNKTFQGWPAVGGKYKASPRLDASPEFVDPTPHSGDVRFEVSLRDPEESAETWLVSCYPHGEKRVRIVEREGLFLATWEGCPGPPLRSAQGKTALLREAQHQIAASFGGFVTRTEKVKS